MDIEQLQRPQHWKKFLQSPKRIAVMGITVILVAAGLIINQLLTEEISDNPILIHPLTLPTQTNTNIAATDAPVSVIEETTTPPVWHSATLVSNVTLGKLLKNYNVSTDDIAAIEALPEIKSSASQIKTGEIINILQDNSNKLYGLRYSYGLNKTLNITREDDQFIANVVTQPIVNKQTIAHGVIKGSLTQSAAHAGVPHKIALEFANMFAWKINFNKDLQVGDPFTIIYDNEYVGDHKIDTGDLVAAQIAVQDTQYTGVRFVAPDGSVGYYSPQGHSLTSGFLRTPVHYSRISSPFSLSRMQPILHFKRPHLGVDLAAPRNTPIEAAGDGTIIFVGKDAGYGNLIIIDHGHGITTRYGHIQRFAKNIHKGMHIKEGQTIAYVGSTGLATGPHLHYEFRIRGIAYDPLKVKLPNGTSINTSYKRSFTNLANQLMAEMNATEMTDPERSTES